MPRPSLCVGRDLLNRFSSQPSAPIWGERERCKPFPVPILRICVILIRKEITHSRYGKPPSVSIRGEPEPRKDNILHTEAGCSAVRRMAATRNSGRQAGITLIVVRWPRFHRKIAIIPGSAGPSTWCYRRHLTRCWLISINLWRNER